MAIRSKLYPITALLINGIYFFQNPQFTWFHLILLILNFLLVLELIYHAGKWLSDFFKLESNFIISNIIGFCFVSFALFTILIPASQANVVIGGILITFILYKIFSKSEQLLFINELVIEFKKNSIGLSVLILFFFLLCLIPNDYHDPLNYHLLGPYLWSSNHTKESFQKFLQIIHCSYFEYLYLFPFSLSKKSLFDKVFSQVFCQLIHFYYGFFLSSLLLQRILKKIGLKKSYYIYAVLFYTLTRLSLTNLAVTAKTDWAIISVGLIIMDHFIIDSAVFDNRNCILLGFLCGICIALKYSYAFFLMPLVILLYCERKINFTMVVLIFSITLLSICPLMLRNYLWTDNPTFPLFNNFFNSKDIGPSWVRGFGKFGHFEFSAMTWIKTFLIKIMAENYLNLLIFVTPIYCMKTKNVHLLKMWAVSFLSLILLFLMAPVDIVETRHVGLAIIILQMVSGILVFKWLENGNHKLAGICIFFLYMILPTKSLIQALPQHQLWKSNYPEIFRLGYVDYVEEELGHSILSHLQATNNYHSIFVISDIPMYYFIDYNSVKIWDWSELDKEMYKTKSLTELLDLFLKFKATHLLVNNYHFDRFYNPLISEKMIEAIKKNNKSIIYHKDQTYLVELKTLREAY